MNTTDNDDLEISKDDEEEIRFRYKNYYCVVWDRNGFEGSVLLGEFHPFFGLDTETIQSKVGVEAGRIIYCGHGTRNKKEAKNTWWICTISNQRDQTKWGNIENVKAVVVSIENCLKFQA